MLAAIVLLAQLAPPTPAPLSQEVLVEAIRADETTPVTTTEMNRGAVAGASEGQEVPFLLGRAPSITFQSDSGLGAGYCYFAMRGINQTRINMTWDGVPLNDPEDAGVYLSNAGDAIDAIERVQIQRGVGTSGVGAPAYGGAIAFESLAASAPRGLSLDGGGGAFGSWRLGATAHSGPRRGGPAGWMRAALSDTDGYRHHSGMRQRALFFGGSWQTPASVAALSGFAGVEDSSLAFVPSTASALAADPRDNPLQPEEVDHFRQDLVQMQWAHRVGGQGVAVAQAYYDGVYGWYRLWADPITRHELDEYRVGGRALGARTSLEIAKGDLAATFGLHAATFFRDHALGVASASRYLNTGHKDEANAFAKLTYTRGSWHGDVEGQLRTARFRFDGEVAVAPVSWTFLNGRAGARRDMGGGWSVYATAGHVTREPTRNDLFAGEDNPSVPYDLTSVRPERVTGLELGAQVRSEGRSLRANVYAMELRDEIALTGELSPIGLLLRRNVGRSYRRGAEIEGAWPLARHLRATVAGEWGAARIQAWDQFYAVTDASGAPLGSTSRTYDDVPALLSPALVANAGATWSPSSGFDVSLLGRYVSRSHLDNTGDVAWTTPPYFDLQGTLTLTFARRVAGARTRLRVFGHNLLDRRIWSSGLAQTWIVRDAIGHETVTGTAAFFPLASRSVQAVMSLEWGG